MMRCSLMECLLKKYNFNSNPHKEVLEHKPLQICRAFLQQHITDVVLLRLGHCGYPLDQLAHNLSVQVAIAASIERKVQTITYQILRRSSKQFQPIKQNVDVVCVNKIVVNFLRATAQFVDAPDQRRTQRLMINVPRLELHKKVTITN